MTTRWTTSILFLLSSLLPSSGVLSQQDWDAVEIRTTPIRGGVHMMTAAGGNLAVFGGPDGVLVVDADYGELSGRILSAVREATAPDSDLRFLVNTHWHFDHTSGNGYFAEAGAVIIAHEGVERLLAEDQVMHALEGREVPAAPEAARPVVTFNDRMNLSLNGDLIHLVHMPNAHTDGDVIVHFRDADVIHLGDLFFNGMYPFIDVDHGGNLSGHGSSPGRGSGPFPRDHPLYSRTRPSGRSGRSRGIHAHAQNRQRSGPGVDRSREEPRRGRGRKTHGRPGFGLGRPRGIHRTRLLGGAGLRRNGPRGRSSLALDHQGVRRHLPLLVRVPGCHLAWSG